MSLSAADIERFARHIVLPEVGTRGQRRLLQTVCAVTGDDAGAAAVRRYARACGLRVTDAWPPHGADDKPDVVVVVEPATVGDAALRRALALDVPLVWFATTPTGFRAGLRPAGAPPPDPGGPKAGEPDAGRSVRSASRNHDIAAAADAVTTVCALALGLPCPPDEYELHLA